MRVLFVSTGKLCLFLSLSFFPSFLFQLGQCSAKLKRAARKASITLDRTFTNFHWGVLPFSHSLSICDRFLSFLFSLFTSTVSNVEISFCVNWNSAFNSVWYNSTELEQSSRTDQKKTKSSRCKSNGKLLVSIIIERSLKKFPFSAKTIVVSLKSRTEFVARLSIRVELEVR